MLLRQLSTRTVDYADHRYAVSGSPLTALNSTHAARSVQSRPAPGVPVCRCAGVRVIAINHPNVATVPVVVVRDRERR